MAGVLGKANPRYRRHGGAGLYLTRSFPVRQSPDAERAMAEHPRPTLPRETLDYLAQRLDGARDLYLLALALGARDQGRARS